VLSSGRRIWLRHYQECVERFPQCEVPLGELEQTDFRRPGHHPTWPFAASDACVERWVFHVHPGCQWGIDRE
jgi:hypothetical protein